MKKIFLMIVVLAFVLGTEANAQPGAGKGKDKKMAPPSAPSAPVTVTKKVDAVAPAVPKKKKKK